MTRNNGNHLNQRTSMATIKVKARTGKSVEVYKGGYKTSKKSKFTGDSPAKTTLDGFAKGMNRVTIDEKESVNPFHSKSSYPASGMSSKVARAGGGR